MKWLMFSCLAALWLWTFTPQESGLFFVIGGLALAAGLWLPPPPGLKYLLALGLVVMFFFQVPFIRQKLTFPLVASLSPQANPFGAFGLSQADYEIYGLIKGQDALVLDARLGSAAPLQLLNPVLVQNFDATYFRGEAVNQWRESKDPAFLRQAGIRYLYVDATWLGYLSEAEYNLIYDPERYALRWQNGEVYFFEALTP